MNNPGTIEEWSEFNGHKQYFANQGTKRYTPYRQDSFNEPYWETNGLKFWMLGPLKSTATSQTRELHDASLVFRADLGNRKCTFTGDASDTNLQDVAGLTHICDDILHASHHASINGADLGFITSCQAKYTVISTKSGVYENVPHPTALRRYSDNTAEEVYRTDTSGTVKWSF